MIYLDIAEQIEKTRKVLHRNIEKYGLDSKEVREVSLQLDELINMYYGKDREETMQAEYRVAYEELKRLTRENKEFPSVQKWDEYAKENNLISSESLKFLSKMNWNKLRNKIKSEIN
ncbi:MAG: aspartyl-phosphate phosphatase Spo0E family protein [Clostridia bacterium]|nr:aspartyl-phosphate phosphatase Spo0E family protein [Clostridia bacterium]